MPDFLIHRNPDGQIVLAVPYASIVGMIMRYPTESQPMIEFVWQQSGQHESFFAKKEDADRYLTEWREWWEGKAKS